MFTIAQARKIDPLLKDVPDEELEAAIADIFGMVELAMECGNEEKQSSKIPSGLLQDNEERD